MNEWTNEEVERALDELIWARTQAEFRGIADRLAERFGRGEGPDPGDAVIRKLWAVMLRADEFVPTGKYRAIVHGDLYGLDRLVAMSRRTISVEIERKRGDKRPDVPYLVKTLNINDHQATVALSKCDPLYGFNGGFGL